MLICADAPLMRGNWLSARWMPCSSTTASAPILLMIAGTTPPSWRSERRKKMFGFECSVVILFGHALRIEQGGLGFLGVFVKTHR